MTPAVEAALIFHARGWVPVRVGQQRKMPSHGDGWQLQRPAAEEIREWGRCNVGVLLGAASGWLTDIDLDCPEAVQLAPHFLMESWAFGRASKLRSHWLYICEGAQSQKFLDLDDRTMLEIRGESSDGSGHQTVLPPSIHESGEAIAWDPDMGAALDGPLVVPRAVLVRAVCKLARATLLMKQGATTDYAIKAATTHRPRQRIRPARRIVARDAPVPKGFDCKACGVVAEGGEIWPTPWLCSAGCIERRARWYVREKAPPAIQGQFGSRATLKAALHLVRGFELDEETATNILEAEYNPRCQPAWKPRELRRKVKQAAERCTRVPTGYLLGVR